MEDVRHVCRRVSEQKTSAFLGWVNGLSGDGASLAYPDFPTLRRSGFLMKIGRQLFSHGGGDRNVLDSDILTTLLSAYYGASFFDASIIDAVDGGSSTTDCQCELDFKTAMVIALLLNVALNNKDPRRYVEVCMKLSAHEQTEVMNTCNFLATETNDRPAPSDLDWKGFLSAPRSESQQTPVTTRRSAIQPQKLVIGDSPSTPVAAPRRGSFDASYLASPTYRSPIMEAISSPVVRSTAKLREKSVEIHKLKRELSEKAHLFDLQSMEVVELVAKLETAEKELASFRSAEKELRSTLWEFQVREEKLLATTVKTQELENQVHSLTVQLEKAKVDREIFKGMENERHNLYAEMESIANERDNYERKAAAGIAHIQRLEERFVAAEQKFKSEMESLINKNEQLAADNRRLRDAVDEARCEEEAKLREKSVEIQRLMKDLSDKAHRFDSQSSEAAELVAKLETAEKELASFRSTENELRVTLCEFQLREEKLSATAVKKQELENEVQSLTIQLEKAKADKETSEGIEKERYSNLYAKMESIANERDNYERAVAAGNAQIQRLGERLQAAEQKFNCEMESFIDKNDQLGTDNRRLRNLVDDTRSEEEAKLREKSVEMQRLSKDLGEKTHRIDLQAMEIAELKAKLETMGKEVSLLRNKQSQSVSLSHSRNSRCSYNCEDEDVIMLENAMDPGDGPAIRLSVVPASRGDSGIVTPGRQRLSSSFSGIEADVVFKEPFPPKVNGDCVARSLQFHSENRDDQDEVWSDSATFKKIVEAPPQTPNWEWDQRLSVLNRRNQSQPDHLKTSYPLETQLLPMDVIDEELKFAPNYEPPASVQQSAKADRTVGSIATSSINQKKTAPTQKSPNRFKSYVVKRMRIESKEEKRAAKTKETPTPTPSKTSLPNSVAFEIPNTPAADKKRFPNLGLKKKSIDAPSTSNAKTRKMKM